MSPPPPAGAGHSFRARLLALCASCLLLEKVLLALAAPALVAAFCAWPLMETLLPDAYVSALCPLDPSALASRWDPEHEEFVEPLGTTVEFSFEIVDADYVRASYLEEGDHQPSHFVGHEFFFPGQLRGAPGPPSCGTVAPECLPSLRAYDPWDRPWRVREGSRDEQRTWRVYSSGPNRLDEGGAGDDVPVRWSRALQRGFELRGLPLFGLALALAGGVLVLRAARATRGQSLLREGWVAAVLASPAWVATALACYWQRSLLQDWIPPGLSAISPVVSCALTLSAVWFGAALWWRTRRPSDEEDSAPRLQPARESGVLLCLGLAAGASLWALDEAWDAKRRARDLERARSGGEPAAGHRLRAEPEFLLDVLRRPEGPPPLLDLTLPLGEVETLEEKERELLAFWSRSDRPRHPLVPRLGVGTEKQPVRTLRRWADLLSRHPYRFRGSILSNTRLLCALWGPARAGQVARVLLEDRTPSFARLVPEGVDAEGTFYIDLRSDLGLRVCDLAAIRFAPLLIHPDAAPPTPLAGRALRFFDGQPDDCYASTYTLPAETRSALDAHAAQVSAAIAGSSWRPAWILIRSEHLAADTWLHFKLGSTLLKWQQGPWSFTFGGDTSQNLPNWIVLGPVDSGIQHLTIQGKGLDGSSTEVLEAGGVKFLELRQRGSALLVTPLPGRSLSPSQ